MHNADDSHIIFCSFSEVTLAPTFARSKTWKRLTDVLLIRGEPKKEEGKKWRTWLSDLEEYEQREFP